jgi:hypothetical protein
MSTIDLRNIIYRGLGVRDVVEADESARGRRIHLAVRLHRPHMTHDDEWRVRQEH